MNSAGMVRITGTRTSTPGVAAKCSLIRGRTGESRTAPSTGMQLPMSSKTSWGGPACFAMAGWDMRASLDVAGMVHSTVRQGARCAEDGKF
ncbi:hypothetical protein Plo01_78410 [Planobispora longispora]|uniref:Uncharacterized protein n=1 Tax=Planobispora longispora TaxID=28887 RepID=A0A8J3RTB5_9ACTN|nr:hypothetical protein Plo01_78410 [Planobispora longispora]